ncbi:MAG: glycosyltransferase family 2 protein [Acidimicrobiales bacterium]
MTAPIPVVLVHRDQPERLRTTVAAFRAQTVPVRMLVVDNGSTAVPVGLGDDVEVVAAGANLGFGPGANVGLRWFLNDSTLGELVAVAPHDALPAPDALERIASAMGRRDRAGLACADYGDGSTPVVDPYFGGILVPATVAEGWEDAGHPHGTLLVARRACLTEIGLFDERYFAYGEEADLGLRATDAGWEVGLVRGAMVENPNLHGAVGAVSYLQLRNTLLLVREHSGCYHAFIRYQLALAQLAIGLVSSARRDPYWHVEGKVLALIDFARGRCGAPPERLLTRPDERE